MGRLTPAMRGLSILLTALLLAGGILPAALAQKAGPDEAALAMLNSARRAFNEGNCAVAAERFREFLRTFPEHRESVSARFGLAISLVGLPDKDYKAVLEALQPLAERSDFPDRPLALYYLGAAHRGLAEQGFTQAEGKPPEEAKRLRAAAADRMPGAYPFQLRWERMADLAVDRSKVDDARERAGETGHEACSMCGRYCSMKVPLSAGRPDECG